MELASYLENIGAVCTLVLGLLALIRPLRIQTFVSVQGVGKEGLSEIRATYGGFFIALAVFVLINQQSVLFMMLGVAWFAAALVRFGTLFIGGLSFKNILAIMFEAAIACLCLSREL